MLHAVVEIWQNTSVTRVHRGFDLQPVENIWLWLGVIL